MVIWSFQLRPRAVPAMAKSVLGQLEVVDAGLKGSGSLLVQTPIQSSTSLDLQMSSSTAEVS